MIAKRSLGAFAPLVLLLAGCPGPGNGGGGLTQLAARDSAPAGGGGGLPTCTAPLGLASVVQPGDEVLDSLKEMKLGSPEPLLQKMMLDSKCFEVVDLDLVADHEVADQLHYMLRPQITVSNPKAAGTNVRRTFGDLLGADTSAGGDLNVREVKTVLSLNDARTGLLLASVEGSASGVDVSGLLGGSDEFDVGGYGSTAEGEVIAAAFADAFARLVVELQDQEIQSASR